MPPVVPFIPLIAAGIAGGATIVGANKQAGAEEKASNLQHQSTEEALADARAQRMYQQQQYGHYLQRLQPYTDMGMNAGRTLGQLVARSPYAQYAQTGQAPPPQQFTLPSSSIGRLIAKS